MKALISNPLLKVGKVKINIASADFSFFPFSVTGNFPGIFVVGMEVLWYRY
jgi:hypothetical protein